MLEFENIVNVKLNRKHVGVIRQVSKYEYGYYPIGSKTPIESYPSVKEVKESLVKERTMS